MNALLTLPSAAIKKINDEQKDILILNSYPCRLDVKRGKLLLVKEESGIVVATCTVKSAFACKKFIRLWWKLRKRIAHMESKWFFYAFLCDKYFLFELDNFQRYNQAE